MEIFVILIVLFVFYMIFFSRPSRRLMRRFENYKAERRAEFEMYAEINRHRAQKAAAERILRQSGDRP